MNIAQSFGLGRLAAGLAVCLAAVTGRGAESSGAILGPASPLLAGVDPGDRLLGELNCVACHSADAAARERLASRQSPRLGDGAPRLTPQFLRAFLDNPHREKPGTTMPDPLHGLAAPTKAKAVDELTHFISSLHPSNGAVPSSAAADQLKLKQGRTLYHSVGCVACHAPDVSVAALQTPMGDADPSLAELRAASVPFGPLARKTTVEELARFLLDPLKSRPSGRMPSMSLTLGEATAIATYLLREQASGLTDPSRPARRIKGLAYQYFEGGVPDTTRLDSLQPVSSGVVESFSLAPRRRDSNIGFRYTGLLTVPRDGEFTFYTSSDDGTRLFIDGQQIVENDGIHPTTEVKGVTKLAAGDHAIQVDYFNGGGEIVLKVLWKGPGINKQEIPGSVLSHQGQPMLPLGEENDFVVDAAKAEAGRQVFSRFGCVSCHQIDGLPPKSSVAPPPSLRAVDPSRGCLADVPPVGAPKFGLSVAQREALRATLRKAGTLSQPRDDRSRVGHTLAALNCLACHSRDGVGGPGARTEYFTSIGEVDLGDEGRVPPHLTRVGDKLRPDWAREVLLNKGMARPYMATRMPQFGAENVEHLLAAFERADSTGAADSPTDAIDAKHGRKLVGAGGLTCVACHTFGPYKSLGVPAMDLTLMTKRLKKDWFRRYLLEPSSLRPGTRMPAFWPNGESANKDILGGNTERQIGAVWAYLSRAREVGVPDGLIQGKAELVAGTEAVIYRNFIDGISRAIGVGYPEKANLCFDANELRLASVWQGPFVDAARHRAGRGEGFIGPLGYNVLKMPVGPAFARLADSTSAWPTATGKAGGFQMRGYTLDERRRPTFRYAFGDVQIDDYPIAVSGELDASFRRTFKLQGSTADQLWFRAWVGTKIDVNPDGTFLADGKVRLKISGAGAPVVRSSAGRSELLVPLVFNAGEAAMVEEILW